jgi:murein DD-endopeptidase MepM/ murein hydrolase activator NlpD
MLFSKRHTPHRHLLSLLLLSLLLLPLLGALACGGEPPGAEPDQLYDRASGFNAGSAVAVCCPSGYGANLRAAPGSSSTVLAVLPSGTKGTVLAGSGSWYRVQATQTGWIHGSLLCPASTPDGASPPSPSAPQPGACTGGFSNPAPGAPVTSPFGWRWGRMHNGIDLGTPSGSLVRAADGGRVDFAAWVSGYGYMIDVIHCGKYTTRYAHLSQFLVKPGQWVARGASIARSGSSGHSTGPHLHFEIRLGGPYGTPVNPQHYIAF